MKLNQRSVKTRFDIDLGGRVVESCYPSCNSSKNPLPTLPGFHMCVGSNPTQSTWVFLRALRHSSQGLTQLFMAYWVDGLEAAAHPPLLENVCFRRTGVWDNILQKGTGLILLWRRHMGDGELLRCSKHGTETPLIYRQSIDTNGLTHHGRVASNVLHNLFGPVPIGGLARHFLYGDKHQHFSNRLPSSNKDFYY